jgi:hypothetical protein
VFVNEGANATTFYDKSSALPGHLLCIIPKVGMKNLSFYLPAINEILNEIAVANYDGNFSLLSGKDIKAISLLSGKDIIAISFPLARISLRISLNSGNNIIKEYH